MGQHMETRILWGWRRKILCGSLYEINLQCESLIQIDYMGQHLETRTRAGWQRNIRFDFLPEIDLQCEIRIQIDYMVHKLENQFLWAGNEIF